MSRPREILVGVVIVASVVVAVLGTLWLQGTTFGRETRQVEALLRDVGQLAPGNAVKLRGVSIGRVEEIRVEPDGEAVRVVMRIDASVRLPEDAVVLLAPESMFGDWQAEILPRTRYTRFPYMEVEEAGVLGGYALPDISRLTAAADQISENLGVLTERVEQAFTEETAQNIAAAIDNIAEVSRRLQDLVEVQATAFSDVAAEVRSSARELGRAAVAAEEAFARAEEILGAPTTDSLLLDTRATVANLKVLSEQLTDASAELGGVLTRADSTFARFDRLAARVEAGEGALGRLMYDSLLVYRAQDVLLQLSVLLEDIRLNPQRYVRLSIF